MKEWFNSIPDKYRDRKRRVVWEREGTQLCTQWSAIGVHVRLAEPYEIEKSVMGNETTLLLEIRYSPIGRCEVVRSEGGGGPGGQRHYVHYENIYVVPDKTIDNEECLYLESVRVKKIPVFGEVVDLRWKGFYESDLYMRMNQGVLPKQRKESLLEWNKEMVEGLNQDAKIKQTLMEWNNDIHIYSVPEYKCWVWTGDGHGEQPGAPSREVWDFYENIAHRLLEPSGK